MSPLGENGMWKFCTFEETLRRNLRSASTFFALLAGSWLALGLPLSRAANVNFWLSNSGSGPVAPTIEVLPGVTTEISLWARPAPGMNLSAFDLNLVSTQQNAISFEHIEVHNPLLDVLIEGQPVFRHQLVFDSTVSIPGPFGPLSVNLQPDRIESFSGLSFFNDSEELSNGGGIGPLCLDEFCTLDPTGVPSWRVATVMYEAGVVGSSTELFLEIGTKGIWHSNEAPTSTSARFGLPNDTLHEWAVPGDADTDDHRNSHMGQPDAVINVVASISDADFDDDNDIDGADFLTLLRGMGEGNTHAEGDTDGNLQVNAQDQAIWESQFGTASFSALTSVPEPTSLVMMLLGVPFVTRSRGPNAGSLSRS